MNSLWQIRLLGPLVIARDEIPIELPASRKVRALFAYLAMQSGDVSRATLCDLLWDAPSDPRGELRWCLSKIRRLLDTEADRLETSDAGVALNTRDFFVDAIAAQAIFADDIAKLDVEQLRSAHDLFRGEFLEGLDVGTPRFAAWLLSQRQRFKTQRIALIEKLAGLLSCGSEEHFAVLQDWLQVAPFDRRAHESFLSALLEHDRVTDADAHVTTAIRQFETEGLNWLPLREWWRQFRATHSAQKKSPTTNVLIDVSKPDQSNVLTKQQRASVAVMPFVDASTRAIERGGVADGLVEDIITRLAKLRAFFVIARGSVFALGEHEIGPQEAGRILNVDYIVSGSVRRRERQLEIHVELSETRTGRVQWTDEFVCALDGAFAALDEIGNRIVAAIAEEIEAAERNRAILKPPNSLDTWEAYHRGLWHMYRFNGADNAHAAEFFRRAVQLDPTFARAHAALSFTHFQNAFLHRWSERSQETDLAFEAAAQSLMADERDPAAHWAMGRALWLRAQHDESVRELARSVELSPNFALGHYTLGFVNCQSGDPQSAIESCNYSRTLSPFDPLQFAMLATNAIAHVRLGNYEEAVNWALKAAARPNAHAHILSIATHCLAVANRLDEARDYAARIRNTIPNYGVNEFLSSFHLEKDTAQLFRLSARRIGFE